MLDIIPENLLNENNVTYDTHYFQPIEPRLIHAIGQPSVYDGPRLLLGRGISRSGEKNGAIKARLTSVPFAFRNSIIGIRLDDLNITQRKVILGILRSSLAKYYHFLTCSTWGFWHNEIHVEEHLSLPICLTEERYLQDRIISALDFLIDHGDPENLLTMYDKKQAQNELDQAIFDLYSLSNDQRDLVTDLCNITLEFFYKGSDSQATQSPSSEWLNSYRDAFLEVWNSRLAQRNMILQATIYAPRDGLLCGLSFELKELGTEVKFDVITDDREWQQWFRRLEKAIDREYSSQFYLEKTIKELSKDSIFIIKRSEKRLWTKSQARQDARELLTEVFKMEWQQMQGETV